MEKLEIMIKLANEKNIDQVLLLLPALGYCGSSCCYSCSALIHSHAVATCLAVLAPCFPLMT